MAWELLKTDYKDAAWNGLKKYRMVDNADGTKSFVDVTDYSVYDEAFIGAKEANSTNEAINVIMSMLENGTDLYTIFQNYFLAQQAAFAEKADQTNEEFNDYVDGLKAEGDQEISTIKTDYRSEMDQYESQQQQLFQAWFDLVKGQLGTDVAGNLQNQIDEVETKVDGFESRTAVFSKDGSTVEETMSDGMKVISEFCADGTIIQKQYENDLLIKTKTVTFSSDGLTIKEDVI